MAEEKSSRDVGEEDIAAAAPATVLELKGSILSLSKISRGIVRQMREDGKRMQMIEELARKNERAITALAQAGRLAAMIGLEEELEGGKGGD